MATRVSIKMYTVEQTDTDTRLSTSASPSSSSPLAPDCLPLSLATLTAQHSTHHDSTAASWRLYIPISASLSSSSSPKSCLAASLCAVADAARTPPSADVAVTGDTRAASSTDPSCALSVKQVKQSSCRPVRWLQDLPGGYRQQVSKQVN